MKNTSKTNSVNELIKMYRDNKIYFAVELSVTAIFSFILHKIFGEITQNAYLTVAVPIVTGAFIIASSFLRRKNKIEKEQEEKQHSKVKFSELNTA